MSSGVKKYNDYKCIWMPLGIADYKLCDNKFECDTCDFYKSLNYPGIDLRINSEKQIEYYSDKINSTIKNLELCKKYSSTAQLYFKNNIILKKFSNNRFYLGLNPVLLLLIDNIKNRGYINETNVVEKNEAFFSIAGDWGDIKIISPFKFFLICDIKKFPEAIYDSRWIGFIETDIDSIEDAILSKEQYENSISNINLKLSEFLSTFRSIGETMMDGGDKIEYLYQIVGKDKYMEILKSLF